MARPEALALWMRAQSTAAGTHGFVVGLSGGVDSAVVARLAQMAEPGAVTAVLLPCHSDPQDQRDALSVASRFSLTTMAVDLSAVHDALVAEAEAALLAAPEATRRVIPAGTPRDRMGFANIKPRLRMTTLYLIASTLNYLVAGTSNRSDRAVGYFTKYGDGAGDLLPIGHLTKGEVRRLAKELGVPDAIIERAPGAGLWRRQTDEEELGFTYAELERYLEEGPQAVSPALAMRIERLMRTSDHKRRMPPIPGAD